MPDKVVPLSPTSLVARPPPSRSYLTGWESRELALCALAVSSGGHLRRLRASILNDSLELLADLLDGRAARSRDGGHITEVGVDANQVGSNAVRLNILDNDVTWATVVAAVTARAEKLADLHDGVVLDGDGSTAVVLDDLVFGVLGSATLDENAAGAL